MNTEILGVVVQIALMVILAYPLGKYIAKVYKGEKTWSDFMAPVERVIYKVCGINPDEEMNWKQFLKALLILNAFWFFWGMVLLVSQGWLPLNPDGNGPQTPDQAFNTCISFMVNCNLQHYSGESGLTYFTQLFVGIVEAVGRRNVAQLEEVLQRRVYAAVRHQPHEVHVHAILFGVFERRLHLRILHNKAFCRLFLWFIV